jgi:hypothetical protein
MPTPFTHLAIAHRLRADPALTPAERAALSAQWGPFLLGSTAADAGSTPETRAQSHFYAYDRPVEQEPWRVMLAQYPALTQPQDAAHHAFLLGYVAHLSTDALWTQQMVMPHFVARDWGGGRRARFYAMHLLLIDMDERDLAQIGDAAHTDATATDADAIAHSQPHDWLPFIPPQQVDAWRDLIAVQLPPRGISRTLDIFGARIGQTPADLRAVLDSPTAMHNALWEHVPPPLVQQMEADMYQHTLTQLLAYWRGT